MYIVYITIDRATEPEWRRWMTDVHVPDVVATGCFTDATVARDPEADTDERVAFRIIYRAPSREAFERYQSKHAEQLQQDHTSRYAERFEARRDLLPIITTLSSNTHGVA